jgi:hypothetical protein
MRFAAPLIALASLFASLAGWQNAGGVDLLANGGFEDGVSGWTWSDGALEPVAAPSTAEPRRLATRTTVGRRVTRSTSGSASRPARPTS